MNQAPHPKLLSKKLLKSEVPNAQAAKPTLVIVSPALASANNGNWQTAKRYRQLLSAHFRVRLVNEWNGANSDDVLIRPENCPSWSPNVYMSSTSESFLQTGHLREAFSP
jgi:hypothetical protein